MWLGLDEYWIWILDIIWTLQAAACLYDPLAFLWLHIVTCLFDLSSNTILQQYSISKTMVGIIGSSSNESGRLNFTLRYMFLFFPNKTKLIKRGQRESCWENGNLMDVALNCKILFSVFGQTSEYFKATVRNLLIKYCHFFTWSVMIW